MTNWKIFLNRLIRDPHEGRLKKVLLFPLALLSLVYGCIVRTRISFYRRGIYRTRSLPCKVISVGNLTLGGTGKTPFVLLLAEMIRKEKLRPIVLSRGYGGAFRGPMGVVSDGEKVLMGPAQCGDEPFLMAMKLKDIPVVVGPGRWAAGRAALEKFGADVIILDDGFQHLGLRRDLNLLLLDATCPFDNGWVFPRGGLREPKSEIRRADAVVLTKVDPGVKIADLKGKLSELGIRAPVFRVRYEVREMESPDGKGPLNAGALRGKKVLGFSGIARPESFENSLRGLGAEILGMVAFPDHHAYADRELKELERSAMRSGADALITTEKDLVR
ncbi:MAG TPA: tetraacyldisaccharide 4'-kinase, partial [Thermodesulfobacteriota bacterium]|nr:tetraacyldisaccharide 4'-kinase [Thermodesulfobacteriota bacterium]